MLIGVYSCTLHRCVNACTYASELSGNYGKDERQLVQSAGCMRSMDRLPPSAANGETEWTEDTIQKSHKRLKSILDLSMKLTRFVAAEATIEAPTNSLVQLYAWMLGEDSTDDEQFWLAVSVAVGIANIAKSLVSLENRGRPHLQDSNGFPYVLGVGGGIVMQVLVGGFRTPSCSHVTC